MKTTFRIPDDIYSKVKAKSASEGISMTSLTIMLYSGWLREDSAPKIQIPEAKTTTARPSGLPCLGIGRKFVRRNSNGPHDMASIRNSIAERFSAG